MQHILTVVVAIAGAAASTAACRLDPLVKDTPGASATVRPSDAVIAQVSTNSDLTTQITLNDSLDTKVLTQSGNIIPRGTGLSGGAIVLYWAFGPIDRAPAPMYVFGTGDPASTDFVQNSHLPLVDALPGDVEYNPLHTLYRVVTTPAYNGEKITTTAALADALQLGLVEPPVATKTFVDSPIVRPGTKLEVGAGGPASPVQVYSHGYLVDTYRLGGNIAVQPNPNGLLPTSQVSFLRGPTDGAYNAARPIFQATIPTTQPQTTANYTPLSVIINVDLSVEAATITKDSELFKRSASGAITGTLSPPVLQFSVTTSALDLQLQFEEGSP